MTREELLKKYEFGLECARKYWVLSEPTGISDAQFDEIERQAREDGLELRDEVRKELIGTRYQNEGYLTPVEKIKVTGDMFDAITEFTEDYQNSTGNLVIWVPKYDGSSIVCYYRNGNPYRVVTAGGANRYDEGLDQTYKLINYFPKNIPSDIKALQCEALVALEHNFGDRSRQKANGLINSKDMMDEVDKYLNIRCFRYFTENCPELMSEYSQLMRTLSYVNSVNDILPKFSPGLNMSYNDLVTNFSREDLNKDILHTDSGTFLIDGWVAYDNVTGCCIKALKYHDAGRGEGTRVKRIIWNNQVSKGKDGWSSNVEIDPVIVRGSSITKPSSGGVKNLINKCISPGALVTVCLANSTIPQVSEVLEPGNGDYQFPKCSCGYQMTRNDIYGLNLKCGNPNCSERYQRVRNYLDSLNNIYTDLDLNRLFIVDRFDFNKKLGNDKDFINESIIGVMIDLILNDKGASNVRDLILNNVRMTGLQLKMFDLNLIPVYNALKDYLNDIR